MISIQAVHTLAVPKGGSDIASKQSLFIIKEAIRAGIMERFCVRSIETGHGELEQESRAPLLLVWAARRSSSSGFVAEMSEGNVCFIIVLL
jgi:hypothetical protein